MRTFYHVSALMACALLTGCGGGMSSQPSVAGPGNGSPVVNDGIRVGDKVTIRLEGVPDGGYVTEVEIPASGEVTVALLTQSFQAVGHTAADLAAEISAAYKTGKIYTNPIVTVLPEERFLSVGGDVRGPTRVAYTPDLTLMSAINMCGGFTEYANRRAVRIIRGQQVISVDCVQAAKVPGADPPVYPGDQITVPRTAF